jgi:hypothetical protein
MRRQATPGATGVDRRPAEIITGMRQLNESPVLPVKPGLCGECRHAAVKGTNRGTAYLRCTRASWDDRLTRYPSLPVTSCAGFESAGNAEGQAPAG